MVLNSIQVVSLTGLLSQLRNVRSIVFDYARCGLHAEARALANAVGLERVVFGSYLPMFNFSSGILQLREAAFSQAESRAILFENARRLLA